MECRSVLLESEKSVDIKKGVFDFAARKKPSRFSTAFVICASANICTGADICAGGAAVVTESVKGLFGHLCIHHVVHRDPFHPVLVTESQTVPDTHLATILFLCKTRENQKTLLTAVPKLPPELSKLLKDKQAQVSH